MGIYGYKILGRKKKKITANLDRKSEKFMCQVVKKECQAGNFIVQKGLYFCFLKRIRIFRQRMKRVMRDNWGRVGIGLLLMGWILFACGTPEPKPESQLGDTARTPLQDSSYTLDRVYALAGKNEPFVWTILDSIDRREAALGDRRIVPAYEIQLARAFVASRDLNPRRAIRYLTPLLMSEELADHPERHLFALALMSNEYMVLHQTDRQLDYTLQYMELARQQGDSVRYAVAYLYLVGLYSEQENYPEADACLKRAQHILKQTTAPRSLEYLLWSREMEIDLLAVQHQYSKAIAVNRRLIDRYESLSMSQRRALDLDQDSTRNFRQAQNWVMLAGLYAHDGQMAAAAEAYRKAQQFLKQAPEVISPQMNSLTFDYLKTAGRYAEARECALRYVSQTTVGDTLNMFHVEAKRLLAEACRLTGDYRQAWMYEHQVVALTDSLHERSNQEAALELQTAYETAQRERQIQEQQFTIVRNRQIIWSLAIGVCVLMLLLWQMASSRHRIARKNRKLFDQIEQLRQAQQELERIRSLMNDTRNERIEEEKDELFERLERLMKDRKLFLQADLNRDQVAAELGTNKLYVSNALSQRTGLTFSEYLNRWRLEYAREILSDDPTIKVEAVALMCGFNSVRTFYRLFQRAYQLTPTEYRRLSKLEDAGR